MKLFCDTSGLYALLDQDDENHQRAASAWSGINDILFMPSVSNSAFLGRQAGALLAHLLQQPGCIRLRSFEGKQGKAVK